MQLKASEDGFALGNDVFWFMKITQIALEEGFMEGESVGITETDKR